MVRRLGFPAWQRLHRLAYVAASLGVVHFFWRVKKDATEPLLYGAVLALLFALRLGEALRKRRARAPAR
jgi:sulfoxide reductase heme-binding subunit YedZ